MIKTAKPRPNACNLAPLQHPYIATATRINRLSGAISAISCAPFTFNQALCKSFGEHLISIKKLTFITRCFAFCILAGSTHFANAATYSLENDFSISANPNGAWTYGYKNSTNGSFQRLESFQANAYQVTGWDRWSPNGKTEPHVLRNSNATGGGSWSTVRVGAQKVQLHPGANLEHAVVRWTSPSSGKWLVNAEFINNDTNSASTNVSVVHNGTALYSGELIRNVLWTGVKFDKEVITSAGDTIDFIVDPKSGYTNDSTGLSVKISNDSISTLSTTTCFTTTTLTGPGTTIGGEGIIGTECTTPTLQMTASNGLFIGSEITLTIPEIPGPGVKHKICLGSSSQNYSIGCYDYSNPIRLTINADLGDYYLAAKAVNDIGTSRYSNELHVTPVWIGSSSYPVIFAHGLASNFATWGIYSAWEQSGLATGIPYGGTLVAIDKYHATSLGQYTNTNVPTGYSQAGCPAETDSTGLYDVRFYYSCNSRGGYFTINFSNNNDLSFTAQAMELRAIVDAVIRLTGKSKAFLVGHSMGGLASRAYIQYLGGESKVAGLITIGTPHQGAIQFVGTFVSTVTDDVKVMLAPNSIDLNMLNDLTRNPWPASVPTYAIALDQGNSSIPGDSIVGERSQRNGGAWDGITVPPINPAFVGIGHLNETNDIRIRSLVELKLKEWSR